MRNLKKILALALVFAMAFTFTASAADFTDAAEIGAKYVDDVNMLVELGVIAGYPDGSFGPAKNITRAEFAKMAYTIKYGSDTDGNLFAAQKSNFTDVEGNANVAWAKGYINYCANQNIVSGVGNGKFNPQGNITVAEATKMLLVILGCDPAKEGFTGANWVANVTAKAIDLGIYNGWTGDPSVLATRELVAKLMRNTIFSSVYTYSAITGMGSQMDALGTDYNDTLGEKTMGLQTVTGIVVANERYAISTDEEGNALGDLNGDGAFTSGAEEEIIVTATGADSEEAVIYYEYQNSDDDTVPATITINRALDDDMLGAKVNVFFKADRVESSSSHKSYKNIEVIGNVLVHSDTVAYTVPAIATDVYPDGDSTSTSTIRPYISFIVDGVEKQINMPTSVAKVAKNVDAQENAAASAAIAAEINTYAYVLENNDIDEDGDLTNPEGTAFIDSMGKPVLSQYRFVSVDGGNTYSYMFKMVDDDTYDLSNSVTANAGYYSVTSYSETAGTIRLQGQPSISGSLDIGEEVVINGEVATDDVVVAYRANGKIVVEKVESFTAAVDSFDDENDGVVLNGETYLKWSDCDLDTYLTLFDYYQDNRGAMNSNTKYYIYNGLIMEIVADDEEVAMAANYAVILRSYYDSDLDTAYVKLGFTDNTEGTYEIGKLYTKKASDPQNTVNDLYSDFDNNARVGMVVSYKILSDGTVDLSDQYFKDEDILANYADGLSSVVGYYDANGDYQIVDGATKDVTIAVNDGKIAFNRTLTDVPDEVLKSADNKYGVAPSNSTTYYALNDNTIVFAIYGKAGYTDDGRIDPKHDDGYQPLKAKAFKLSEIYDMHFSDDSAMNIYANVGGYCGKVTSGVGHVVLNSKSATSQYVVVASMTVGTGTSEVQYQESNSIGYVISARQYYNAATSKYYASLVLINEDGRLDVTTIEDVKDLNTDSVLTETMVGPIDDEDGVFPAGSFVRFSMNSENKIDVIDIGGGELDDIKTEVPSDVSSGLYLVNITGIRNGIVSFYDTKDDVNTETDLTNSLQFHEDDGCKLIGISDDDYTGETVKYVASRVETLEAEKGNAIIQVEEGQIVRIFSFEEDYVK